MTDAAPQPEYPHMQRHIKRWKGAPSGQKRRRAERLQRARTASLKREIAKLSTGRA